MRKIAKRVSLSRETIRTLNQDLEEIQTLAGASVMNSCMRTDCPCTDGPRCVLY